MNNRASGCTKAALRDEVIRLAIAQKGASTFALERRPQLAHTMTEMLAAGEIKPVESQYPWVGFAVSP